MIELRERAVEWALRLDGLTADPQDFGGCAFARIIAPGETPFRASEMVRSSTCFLLVSEYIRQACAKCPPLLEPPYINTRAPANVLATAKEAGAIRPPGYEPNPGDLAHLSPGGGGVEHGYIITAAQSLLYGGVSVQSIDAGQKPDGRNQGVLTRYRILAPQGNGQTLDDEFPLIKGGYAVKRPVFAIYDLEAIVNHFS